LAGDLVIIPDGRAAGPFARLGQDEMEPDVSLGRSVEPKINSCCGVANCRSGSLTGTFEFARG